MKIFIVAAVLALAFVSVSMAGTPDPRKCHWNNARQCASDAATLAVRHALAKRVGVTRFYGDVTCLPRNGKFLLWACTMKTSPGLPTKASVRFWANSAGWHTAVTLAP